MEFLEELKKQLTEATLGNWDISDVIPLATSKDVQQQKGGGAGGHMPSSDIPPSCLPTGNPPTVTLHSSGLTRRTRSPLTGAAGVTCPQVTHTAAQSPLP